MATITGGQIATKLLQDLNAPVNTATVRAVAIWLAFESGSTIAGNNPWNIHGTGNCGYRMADTPLAKVAVYCTIDDGVAASARLLSNSSYYTAVVAALRKGDVVGFFWALVKSPWSASHYGGDISKFWGAFTGSYNYSSKVYTLSSGGSTTGGTGSGTTVSTGNAFTTALDTYIKPFIGTKSWAAALDQIPSTNNAVIMLTSGLSEAFPALGINGATTITQVDYDKVRAWALTNLPDVNLNPIDAIGSTIEFVGLFVAFILIGIVMLIVAAIVSGNAGRVKGE